MEYIPAPLAIGNTPEDQGGCSLSQSHRQSLDNGLIVRKDAGESIARLLLLFGVIDMLKPTVPVCPTITEKGRAHHPLR